MLYFNPRSREGSDHPGIRLRWLPSDFNPRSREGSDKANRVPPTVKGISIRAPARGATCALWCGCLSFYNFNPRSREGSDPKTMRSTTWHWDFNPRSREGSDQINDTMLNVFHNFNPRSREGSDNSAPDVPWYTVISIRAPARGATR